MKYKEFENKPFGMISLMFLTITWSSYIGLSIYLFLNMSEGIWSTLFFFFILSVLHFVLQGALLSMPYDILGRRKKEENISVVLYVYENFVNSLLRIITLFLKGAIELFFRRYYLRLYHFVVNINTLADKLEEKVDEFKSQNDKLIK